MKKTKTLQKQAGQMVLVTPNAAVGRSTADYAAPVNPPLIKVVKIKSPKEVLPSPGFLTLRKQCLSNQTHVPAVQQDVWAWVSILKYEDKTFSEIVYIIIIYNAIVVGAKLWITSQVLFVVVVTKLTHIQKPTKMKSFKNAVLGLAESEDPYLIQISVELSKLGKAAASFVLQECLGTLKAERKLMSSKGRKLIDVRLRALRTVLQTLQPKAKSHMSSYDDQLIGLRGHMVF